MEKNKKPTMTAPKEDIIMMILFYMKDNRTDYAEKVYEIFEHHCQTPSPTGDRDCEELLLSFCHFLGKAGYKINGYDDGQLLTVIEQFKAKQLLK